MVSVGASVAFSHDGKRAVTTEDNLEDEDDETFGVRVWDVDKRKSLPRKIPKTWHDRKEGKPQLDISGLKEEVPFAAFTHGRVMTTGTNTARLWDANTGKCLKVLKGHAGTLKAAAVSPTTAMAATGADDGALCLWDVAKGKSLRTWSAHARSVRAWCFSDDGSYVVSTGSDDNYRAEMVLWEVASGERVASWKATSKNAQLGRVSMNNTASLPPARWHCSS